MAGMGWAGFHRLASGWSLGCVVADDGLLGCVCFVCGGSVSGVWGVAGDVIVQKLP